MPRGCTARTTPVMPRATCSRPVPLPRSRSSGDHTRGGEEGGGISYVQRINQVNGSCSLLRQLVHTDVMEKKKQPKCKEDGSRCERHDAQTSSETFLTGNQLTHIGLDLDLGRQTRGPLASARFNGGARCASFTKASASNGDAKWSLNIYERSAAREARTSSVERTYGGARPR